MDRLHLKNSLIQDTTNNVTQEKTTNRTKKQPNQNHADSIKGDSIKK
jgi:hypothetical protein